jgi:hypothetical protein
MDSSDSVTHVRIRSPSLLYEGEVCLKKMLWVCERSFGTADHTTASHFSYPAMRGKSSIRWLFTVHSYALTAQPLVISATYKWKKSRKWALTLSYPPFLIPLLYSNSWTYRLSSDGCRRQDHRCYKDLLNDEVKHDCFSNTQIPEPFARFLNLWGENRDEVFSPFLSWTRKRSERRIFVLTSENSASHLIML